MKVIVSRSFDELPEVKFFIIRGTRYVMLRLSAEISKLLKSAA